MKMLIEYLPPVVNKIKEMQAICNAEQPEFDEMAAEIDQVLLNMFITTANEYGISRFEQELGIKPKEGSDLEERRLVVLTRANKDKVSASKLISILSNYAAGTQIYKDFNEFVATIVLNADATSLQTIFEILDERLPLNIYYYFLLRREELIGVKISSKIFTLYDKAAGDQQSCGNENQITSITKTAVSVKYGGFCNINTQTAAGVTACGAGYDEITTQPTYTMQAIDIEVAQAMQANNNPNTLCGVEYAGKEV